ncbi:MAG: tRNA modification GTPase [Myxococcota bacterium]|nr:tRNA modification GTPase [Myxococcota bacterium]
MQAPIATLNDTIVAPATAPGEAAVAIVRLSGRLALEIGQILAPGKRRSHVMHRATIVDGDGGKLDDALVCEMHAPRSYTGEPVVELHLHGARFLVESVVARSCELGARPAEPGEFTLRAFLHGRMDLTQAEAVADVLSAANAKQLGHAQAQLEGALSKRAVAMLTALEEVVAEGRASFDFPEYDTGAGLAAEHLEVVAGLVKDLHVLIEGARPEAKKARTVVLCGAPNVGKSSLLNAWSGSERVLVDDAPGTTRDPIEVEMTEGLQRWSVWDTAGFREEAVGLEARGIALALERARTADLAVWVVAPDAPVWPPAGLDVRVIGGKADQASVSRRTMLESDADKRGFVWLGWVSTRTGEGVEALRARLSRGADNDDRAGHIIVVRERQVTELKDAAQALEQALNECRAGATVDVVVSLLEAGAFALGRLLGRNVDAAVLDRVFADFCIGK